MKRVFITGSSGLIGSEMVRHFDALRASVVGTDTNMRADFFGPEGDTHWNLERLRRSTRAFRHFEVDIRDRDGLQRLVRREGPFDLIVHCAAQPSHDLATARPLDDFDVNAAGTINVLEAVRQSCPDAVFVHLSTNKVYGNVPNELPVVELPRRWDYARAEDREGVTEATRIDQTLHSVFGASKMAADVMVQEYGRYFGLRTTCLRCGCLTGPSHAGVPLHGFLSYLVKAQLQGRPYTIHGYKGKQVRDNIHSLDVALAIEAIYRRPGVGAVYNFGGGRANSCSILEAFDHVERLTGRAMESTYRDEPRKGDHICYVSALSKFRRDYPEWAITCTLEAIFEELIRAWNDRMDQ
jgi:CDP-paratose 2-epimerase